MGARKFRYGNLSSMETQLLVLLLAISALVIRQVSLASRLSKKVDTIIANSDTIPVMDEKDTEILTKRLNDTDSNHESYGTLVVTAQGCVCELVSVDCLSCVRNLPSSEEAQRYISLGVLTRRAIKDIASFDLRDDNLPGLYPIGKATQYTTIRAWRAWVESNRLPPRFDPEVGSIFINETWYPDCVSGGRTLKGRSCFFAELYAEEDLEREELNAMAQVRIPENGTIAETLRADIYAFQGHARREEYDRLPALGYLLAFAHMARICFNRRPHMHQIYERRVESVLNKVGDPGGSLRVGLHLRRADSCSVSAFETNASRLDSVAQVSSKRMCYETSVYIDALRRAQKLAERPVDVYLSTDDAGSVLEEIRNDHQDVYNSMNWHFLNYSRDMFDYEGFIEGNEVDRNQQALLGESAVSDLFHLSNVEVFIGHLGSRFGKISWLLATARRNTFIPFFSVDGHSVCCEVDEMCAGVKHYISDMENCLVFVHDLLGIKMNKDYWKVGSTLRKTVWEQKKN